MVLIEVSIPLEGVNVAVSKGPSVLYAIGFLMVLCMSPVGLKSVILTKLGLLVLRFRTSEVGNSPQFIWETEPRLSDPSTCLQRYSPQPFR